MTDETDPDELTATDAEFDADTDIVSYDPETVGADELYDLRSEAEYVDAVALAARIEIERQNALRYDNYEPSFGQHELLDVGMMLMAAKEQRYHAGQSRQVQLIESLSETLLDGFDFEDEVTHE